MTNRLCFLEDDVKKVFITTSNDKDDEVFESTHVPLNFEGFKEDEVIERIIQEIGRTESILVTIQGNAGSGKSEFCRKLKIELEKHSAKRKDFVVIHVNKNDAKKPQTIFKKISEVLYSTDGAIRDKIEKIESNWEKKIETESGRTTTKKLLKAIVADKLCELFGDSIDEDAREKIEDKLDREVNEYVKSLVSKLRTNLTPRSIVSYQKLKEILLDYVPTEITEEQHLYIIHESNEFMNRILEIDAVALFDRLGEYFNSEDKTPILIFDDLSTHGNISTELVDWVTEVDRLKRFTTKKGGSHTRGWIIILGLNPGLDIWTTLKEATYVRRSMGTKAPSFEITAFDPEMKKEVILKHLTTLKERSTSHARCNRCSLKYNCKVLGLDPKYYPFTSEGFFRLIENCIRDEIGYYIEVFRILLGRMCRNDATDLPLFDWDVSEKLYMIQNPIIIPEHNPSPKEKDGISFMKYFGVVRGEYVYVDNILFEWVGLKPPSIAQSDGKSFKVRKFDVGGHEPPETVVEPIEKPGSGVEQPDTKKKIIDISTELKTWMDGGPLQQDVSNYLRQGIVKLMEYYHIVEERDPIILGNKKAKVTQYPLKFRKDWSYVNIPIFVEDGKNPIPTRPKFPHFYLRKNYQDHNPRWLYEVAFLGGDIHSVSYFVELFLIKQFYGDWQNEIISLIRKEVGSVEKLVVMLFELFRRVNGYNGNIEITQVDKFKELCPAHFSSAHFDLIVGLFNSIIYIREKEINMEILNALNVKDDKEVIDYFGSVNPKNIPDYLFVKDTQLRELILSVKSFLRQVTETKIIQVDDIIKIADFLEKVNTNSKLIEVKEWVSRIAKENLFNPVYTTLCFYKLKGNYVDNDFTKLRVEINKILKSRTDSVLGNYFLKQTYEVIIKNELYTSLQSIIVFLSSVGEEIKEIEEAKETADILKKVNNLIGEINAI